MDSSPILHVLEDFTQNSNSPENFICAQPQLEAIFTEYTKRIFDLSCDCHVHKPPSSASGLTELVIEGLDSEQIWEEIELTNSPLLKYMVHNVAKLLTCNSNISLVEDSCQERTKGEGNSRNNKSDDESDQDEVEQEYDGSQDLFPESRDVVGLNQDSDVDSSDQDSETNFDIEDLEGQSKKHAKKSSKKAGHLQGFHGRTSVVDDTFFKLSEMERFLEMEDAKEERRRRREEAGGGDEEEDEDQEDSDAESVDLFDDLSSDEGSSHEEHQEKSARDMCYIDYFENDHRKMPSTQKRVHFEEFDIEDNGDEEDSPHGRKMKSDEEDSNDSHDDDDGAEEEEEKEEEESEGEDLADILGSKATKLKSTFEKRQEKLKQKIEQLEDSNITEKPWQLSGEARGSKRPENSLLQEDLDFEVTSKPAPVITEETTQALEDIIHQRVLDHAWDDVERKERRHEEPYEFKKRITLDQEKSKLSLAEIYEKEYLKHSEQEKEEEVNPAHNEIKTMMDALFVKLDALSNFHYMPKPVLPEVKIVKNVPSISMEEVAPITATDASLLAPEEIQEKSKSELKGETEKTTSDRKQARRQKKKGQKLQARDRLRKQRNVEKLKPGTGNKNSMKGAIKRLEQDSKMPSSKTTIIKDGHKENTLKSSKSFFGRLQDEVTSDIHGMKRKKRPQQHTLSGKKLKL